jgi:4-oxalocrotonate tautomerase
VRPLAAAASLRNEDHPGRATIRARRSPERGGHPMPFVNIRIYEGWGQDKLDEIAKRVTQAIHDVTSLPKEAVWVVMEEVDPPQWYVAGKPGERMKT